MEWEQTSKILVGVGTVIVLSFAIVIVLFMMNLKRRLNRKQHEIDDQEKKHKNEVDKLESRIKRLEDRFEKFEQSN